MLMIPPALQTKSGAQRMPRSASALGERVVGELVVRGAGDRLAAQRGHGVVVEHAAERARRERRRRRRSAPRRVGPLGARRSASSRLLWSTSATTSSAPPCVQHLGQRGRRRCRARSRRCGGRRGRRCRTRARRSTRSAASQPSAVHGLGIAGAAALEREPGDVLGAAPRSPPCRARTCRRPRRSGSSPPSASTVSPKSCSTASRRSRRERRLVRAQHDHALAAAQRQAGDGGLERHRAREPQHVAHGVARVVVGPHPAAAERGPRAVEWTATIVNRPERRPRRTSSASWCEGLGVAVDAPRA